MKYTFEWTKVDDNKSTVREPVTELVLEINKIGNEWDVNGYTFPTEQDAKDAAEACAAWGIARHKLSADNKAK